MSRGGADSRSETRAGEDRAPGFNADTLERLVPDLLVPGDATGLETLALHVERYEFAARHVRGSRVLDIACGVGYGTRLLADRCQRVARALGVDLDPESVAYAAGRYGGERVEFVAGDAMRFTEREPFDTIVSLETVEHLPDPDGFLRHLQGLLAPGGILVASVPTTPSTDGNPHHLHDFTESSWRAMGAACHLREIDCLRQAQPYSPFSVVKRSEARMQEVRRNLPAYYLAHPSSLMRRIWSLVSDGFVNRYLTIAWQRRTDPESSA